jgi:hypothetical protein
VAVSPDGASVYVANVAGDTVSQYDVGEGGALSPKFTPTVPASQPQGVAISPNGKSVYVTNADTATVSRYNVSADGSLSAKNLPTVAAGTEPGALAASPDGRSVYVANTGGNSISQYDVGSFGMLSPKSRANISLGVSPRGIAVSPNSKSVYVTSFGGVSQFSVGAGGRLSPMPGHCERRPRCARGGGEPGWEVRLRRERGRSLGLPVRRASGRCTLAQDPADGANGGFRGRRRCEPRRQVRLRHGQPTAWCCSST